MDAEGGTASCDRKASKGLTEKVTFKSRFEEMN